MVWARSAVGFVAIGMAILVATSWLVVRGLRVQDVVGEPERVVDTAAPRHWQAGEYFHDCAHCPEMVVLPAGRFVMGSPEGELGRYVDEGPRHEVVFERSFAMGRHEVTFAEWDACVADGGCAGYAPNDASWGRCDRPVINVSWDDTQSYIAWLREETDAPYRLANEAEWEYAARTGTASSYHVGNTITADQANYRSYRTMPVGSYPANAFGLHDMHGNVWEWVQDDWRPVYDVGAGNGVVTNPDRPAHPVLRGGSWLDGPKPLRSAARNWSRPTYRYDYFGFRVARDLH